MAITRAGIIDAIQDGMNKANKKYENWSNGMWVTEAGVEGLMVTYISEAVSRLQEEHESLHMEVSFKEIKEESGAKPGRGRRPAIIKNANRADIVLFNGNRRPQPTCVIEVKRSWNAGQCLKDLKRIRDLVHYYGRMNNGSLRRGFLVMMIVKGETENMSADDRIEEQMEKIEQQIDEEFKSNDQHVRYHRGEAKSPKFQYSDRDYMMASFCIEISGRN